MCYNKVIRTKQHCNTSQQDPASRIKVVLIPNMRRFPSGSDAVSRPVSGGRKQTANLLFRKVREANGCSGSHLSH